MATVEVPAELKDIVTPGTLLEHYNVGAVVGKGGFASVRLGDRKTDRKAVALKILDNKIMRNLLRDPRQAQQIKQVRLHTQRLGTRMLIGSGYGAAASSSQLADPDFVASLFPGAGSGHLEACADCAQPQHPGVCGDAPGLQCDHGSASLDHRD